MPKYELINKLYELQQAICPLCLRSLLNDLQMYVAWKTKTAWKGKKLKRKDVNLNVDHIKCKHSGGDEELDNLALVHKSCNVIKDNIDFQYDKPKRHTQPIQS